MTSLSKNVCIDKLGDIVIHAIIHILAQSK